MPITRLTAEDLIAFECEIAEIFNASRIRSPIHLYQGNESEMLAVFEGIKEDDWVIGSWRFHYQCLLKGVPPEVLKREILAGRSMSLSFPEYRLYASAIVTGSLPIAAGIALGIKRRGGTNRVHCFMGEMTSETGVAHETIKYSRNHGLPIRFIIEDNNRSVCTDTRKVWNQPVLTFEKADDPMVVFYKYETQYPHAGAGKRVQF